MSASYEQRHDAVADALWENGLRDRSDLAWIDVSRLAEAALDALDHIPENVGWVCQGQPRDPVTKGAA